MAITFAASPDGLERGELERLLSGYVRTWADGGHPLLRLVTQRDVETVYAEIAAIRPPCPSQALGGAPR